MKAPCGGASGIGGDLVVLNAIVSGVTTVAGIVYTMRAINALEVRLSR
jgi:hypothetical protein